MKAITDVFNWLQVKMSGQDIKIKMANKASNGGTIGRAPLGYLNQTVQIDGRKINTVVLDPDRAKYVVMAFELWATGDYPSVASLRAELTKAGLRTTSGKPVLEKTLYNLLRDRYYLGYVTYEGIEYQGRHEPLISEELFDRAQRVIDAHGGAGTRQRSHNHYLRGVLWCGRCQNRLIVQRAQGRHGGEYYYFFCRSRQDGACDLPYMPVELMEDAVIAYYADAVSLPQAWLDQLRAGVDDAVHANIELSDALRAGFTNRLTKLDQREDYFLDLAAEENWPKDKLRTKIDGIRHERKEIEDTLTHSGQRLDHSRNIFHHALTLLADPQQAYKHGNEAVRTLLNKVFFVRLYVDAGKITDHQTQEPFDAIFEGYRAYRLGHAWESQPGTIQPRTAVSAAPPQEHGADDLNDFATLPALALAGHVSSKGSNVELRGIEPLTFSMRTRRATNCATAPWSAA
jgi:site-specific DNA recombinase